MAGRIASQTIDGRIEPRDEVFHRVRVTMPDRRSVRITLVNLSPHGMMARIDGQLAPGDTIEVALPVIGVIGAAVRWSLGGRIGCEFDRGIAAGDYRALLAGIGGKPVPYPDRSSATPASRSNR